MKYEQNPDAESHPDALREIVAGVAAATGEAFFDALVQHGVVSPNRRNFRTVSILLVFLRREISDPVGMLTHPEPGDTSKPGPPLEIPPEVIAEALDRRIRQRYADWADRPLPALDGRTPREAIETAEGLEQVKFLLHTYEHGEMKHAREQRRTPVSYDFLWCELGITP